MSDSSYDFKEHANELLKEGEGLLKTWLPQGVVRGREFVCGNLQGVAGSSLSINLDTGVWKDFATGEGGSDFISLYAAIKGVSQGQAYQMLGGGAKPKYKPKVVQKTRYKYNDDYFVLRVDYDDLSKAHYGKYKGQNKHAPAPRPLYHPVAFDPKKPIMIVEGEKAALKASEYVDDIYNVITWPMGTNNALRANWNELIERGAENKNVLIWPDHDDPGYKVAAQISQVLKNLNFSVAILDLRKLSKEESKKIVETYDAYDYFTQEPRPTRDEFIKWGKSIKTVVGDFSEDGDYELEEEEVKNTEPSEPKTQKPKPKKKTTKKKKKKVSKAVQKRQEEERHEIIEDNLRSAPKPAEVLDSIPDEEETDLDASNISHFDSVGLERSKGGSFVSNLFNISKVIRHHPLFKNRFFFDEFFSKIFVREGQNLRPILDKDIITTTSYCQMGGLSKATKTNVADAIEMVANENIISQPKMEIESYEWDGKERIDSFFSTFFTPDPSMQLDYLKAVSKNFWISMIARVYREGCKMDNMFVIESTREGIRKSTALEVIGGDYHSSASGTLGTKDFLENTLGYFLIEDPELVAINGITANQQKSFLSRRSDTFRKAYGRYSNEVKRQFILVGTTNDDSYLDNKGDNRRFIPIKVSRVDLDKIKEERTQLFAEARERFKKGESWWEFPQESHRAMTDSKNLSYFAQDPWYDEIKDHIESFPESHQGYLKTNDIMKHFLGISSDKKTRKDALRIGKILKDLGYKYETVKDLDGKTVKVWVSDISDRPFQFIRAPYMNQNYL